jgi:hypothetical protein
MSLKIIAGPCSIDFQNKQSVIESLGIKFGGKSALYGVRVVGLKSRTAFDPENAFIGIDIEAYMKNSLKMLENNANHEIFPSVEMANEIQEKNNDIYIATEVVDSWVQCKNLADHLKSNKAIVWNPAVNHLGFPSQINARFAQKFGWMVGIKNGKSLGASLEKSETQNSETSLDKSWSGLASYGSGIGFEDIFMIHRGVDLGDNFGFRNYPVHELCKRVKMSSKKPMYFDPSHICGPKKRSEIVDITIEAMKMSIGSGFLYDGVLIECGVSKSDTDQHITYDELEFMVGKISEFRKINE